jgi:hypothetical protein
MLSPILLTRVEFKEKKAIKKVFISYVAAGDKNEIIAKNLVKNGIVIFNQSIVFNDYSKDELFSIFKQLLKDNHNLDPDAEAEEEILKYIKGMNESARNSLIVNARTVVLVYLRSIPIRPSSVYIVSLWEDQLHLQGHPVFET